MFDNIHTFQWFLWSVSIVIAFLLGAGLKALWELLGDVIVKMFQWLVK